MSYQDIASHLKEMYDFDVSLGTISAVTDKLLPVITEWRSRPLEAIYSILFLDGMYFKSRENGKVVTKVIYNILGINQEGYKDILGFYVAALFKLVYCACQKIAEKWTAPLQNWALTISQLHVYFEGRLNMGLSV